MRYPLWVFNSALFILVISAALFIVFSREELPERVEIEAEITRLPVRDGVPTINLKQIYENDLFGTYIKPSKVVKEPEYVSPFPEPPEPVSVEVPEKVEPTFSDPLQLTLKGVMSLSDGTKNKAIIANNKTNQEGIYKIGDKFEDAQLIRIFKNKIIFVRSNGQQEVFYLRQEDARKDPTYSVVSDWGSVVRRVEKNKYYIYLSEFKKRIKSLAHFIDILDLTTAYKKGAAIGCRIGATEKHSLADALGFEKGDIVLTISGIPVTDTKNRLEIYKKLIQVKIDDVVVVRLERRNRIYTLRYKIADFEIVKRPAGPALPVTPLYIQQEQEKMLQQKQKMAPTIREIRKQERRNMLRKGKKPVKTRSKVAADDGQKKSER